MISFIVKKTMRSDFKHIQKYTQVFKGLGLYLLSAQYSMVGMCFIKYSAMSTLFIFNFMICKELQSYIKMYRFLELYDKPNQNNIGVLGYLMDFNSYNC